jgi:hypothetical protein
VVAVRSDLFLRGVPLVLAQEQEPTAAVPVARRGFLLRHRGQAVQGFVNSHPIEQ